MIAMYEKILIYCALFRSRGLVKKICLNLIVKSSEKFKKITKEKNERRKKMS